MVRERGNEQEEGKSGMKSGERERVKWKAGTYGQSRVRGYHFSDLFQRERDRCMIIILLYPMMMLFDLVNRDMMQRERERELSRHGSDSHKIWIVNEVSSHGERNFEKNKEREREYEWDMK